jgi:outer membrane lipoprotein SlyB
MVDRPQGLKTEDDTMKKLMMAVMMAAVALPGPVLAAQDRDRDGSRDGYRDRDYRDRGRNYRGRDSRRYQDCKRSSGTTGTLAGGAGGAVLGNVLGGGTLGTVAGGVGGALLGRHLDKKHDASQNRKNGC